MVENRHILDDVLRRASEQMQVPQVADRWEVISGALIRRRRRRKALIWSTVLVPIGLFGIYLASVHCPLRCPQTIDVVEVDEQTPGMHVPVDGADSSAQIPDSEVSSGSGDRISSILKDLDVEPLYLPYSDQSIPPVYDQKYTDPRVEFDEFVVDSREIDLQEHPVTIEMRWGDSILKSEDDPAEIRIPTYKPASIHPGSGRNKHRLELGLSVSPGIASKLLSESSSFGWLVNRKYLKSAKNERSAMSYQIDLYANHYINEQVYFGSGLRMTERSERVNYQYKIDELVIVRTKERKLEYAPLAPSLVKEISYNGTNSYRYLDIPLKVGYIAPIKQGLQWRTELGAVLSYLASMDVRKVHATTLELSAASDLRVRRFNPGLSVQSGLILPAGNSSDFTLDGVYSMNLGSWRAAEQGILEKPYHYGLMLGWKYSFGTR